MEQWGPGLGRFRVLTSLCSAAFSRWVLCLQTTTAWLQVLHRSCPRPAPSSPSAPSPVGQVVLVFGFVSTQRRRPVHLSSWSSAAVGLRAAALKCSETVDTHREQLPVSVWSACPGSDGFLDLTGRLKHTPPPPAVSHLSRLIRPSGCWYNKQHILLTWVCLYSNFFFSPPPWKDKTRSRNTEKTLAGKQETKSCFQTLRVSFHVFSGAGDQHWPQFVSASHLKTVTSDLCDCSSETSERSCWCCCSDLTTDFQRWKRSTKSHTINVKTQLPRRNTEILTMTVHWSREAKHFNWN